jgi:hypothetical protein
MRINIKHILFGLVMVMLILPALQGYFHIIPENPLHGDFEEKPRPELTEMAWLKGTYQEAMDPWIEQHIGFHSSLVRLHNQYDYSLFGITNAEGIVEGKNGQLYEYDYIRAWMGIDFVGETLLDRKLRQFRFLQQYLSDSCDIDLILVLEPGKASVCPEDIPDEYAAGVEGKTNYSYIRERAKELGINLIDFNAWFLQIKDTAEYPLFPLQGTHWSEFAMWYAADSLIRYIEDTRGIDLPEVIKEGMAVSDDLQSTDYDVGRTLNLICELPHGPMPYPQYSFGPDTGKQKPNVLAIADSYYWNIFNTGIPEHLFNNEAFWYFYKMVYPDTYYGDKFVKDLNLREEVEQQDVIFFMSTERFLYKFDRGFVDDLFAIYGVEYSRNRLTRYKTAIANLDSWFADVIEKAKTRGISLGEMLELDARYMLWQEDPEQYHSLLGPGAVVNNIRENPEWLNTVREKAGEEGISPDSALMAEAMFIMQKDHPEALKKYLRIEEIKTAITADSSWHAYILEKAAYYFMTEEEMLQADAEYIYGQESGKGNGGP